MPWLKRCSCRSEVVLPHSGAQANRQRAALGSRWRRGLACTRTLSSGLTARVAIVVGTASAASDADKSRGQPVILFPRGDHGEEIGALVELLDLRDGAGDAFWFAPIK